MKIKPLKRSELEVGGIYKNKSLEKVIFCGIVNTTFLKPTDRGNFEYDLMPAKNLMLFYYLTYPSSTLKDRVKIFKKDFHHYYFDLKKSHSFIQKIDRVNVPGNNFVKFIKQKANDHIKKMIIECSNPAVISSLRWYVCTLSRLLNMYPRGEKEVEIFNIKKYLLFM